MHQGIQLDLDGNGVEARAGFQKEIDGAAKANPQRDGHVVGIRGLCPIFQAEETRDELAPRELKIKFRASCN
ncbi:MAG: hypothetical protein ACJ746_10625 [Bryobacteraceae bacterium]